MKFIYFDLGKVILDFSHRKACENVSELAKVDADEVWRILFESGLSLKTEDSQISDADLHAAFCRASDCEVRIEDFQNAFADIFTPIEGTMEIIQQLSDDGWTLGILSNTCAAHWDFVTDGRYAILSSGCFSVHALSFELRCMKPDPTIYAGAAKLAQVDPSDIFFTDDRPENIAGAKAAGFDAVQFSSPEQLKADLDQRLSRLGKNQIGS